MCDNKGNNNLNTGLSFVAGTLLGALVGAAAIVLLNPTTGAENRKKVATSAKKYSEKGEELLDEAMQTATKVKSAASPYVQNAAERVSPYISSAAAKINGQPAISETAESDFGADSENEQIQMLVDEPLEKTKKTNAQKNKKYFKKTS